MFVELTIVTEKDSKIKNVVFNKNRIMSVYEEDKKCVIRVRSEANQQWVTHTLVEEYEDVKAKLLSR